jgi:cytochrome c oxidase subunit 1
MGSITVMFALGGIIAAAIRLELVTPPGDLLQAETYNKLFTLHGVIMVFFFLIPSIPATLGNFLLPLMIGARDLAFPRINLLSWYLFMAGAGFAAWSLISGGVDTGWTFYTPYSTAFSNTHVISAAMGAFIAGFSSILTGLNFIVTIHKMRAPGLTWFRLPLFVWAHYATSIIMILGTPVIAVTLMLVMVERGLHLGIFDPALGGDPVLFQHLFWFYSHPAAMARKRIFGYGVVAMSSLAIAVIGFLVWGHHMFVSGQSVYAGMVFSALSFLVAIPSAIKVFNWTATLYKGSVSYDTPTLYAIGFIGLFTIGGLTGIFLAAGPEVTSPTPTSWWPFHPSWWAGPSGLPGRAALGRLGDRARLYPRAWGLRSRVPGSTTPSSRFISATWACRGATTPPPEFRS